MAEEVSRGIMVDQHVMGGKPVIKGTGIPVDLILDKLSQCQSIDALLSDYPELTTEHVKDCLRYASTIAQKKKRMRRIRPW